MKHLNDLTTIDQVKTQYLTLAKQLHPLTGGSIEQMKELNDEYGKACALILVENSLAPEEFESQMYDSEQYREVLEKINPLVGIEIEVIGQWIWVTGDTYGVKDDLKAAGLYYASKRKAWCFRVYDVNEEILKQEVNEHLHL